MFNNKLVSVIIPAYNCETTIIDCLNSIANQSYKNIEIIVVNDGSTDMTLSKLKTLENKNTQLKIISQMNQGVASARNLGIDNSNGEYLLFVDSDDLLNENAIENLILGYKYDIEMSIGSFIENFSENKKEVHYLPVKENCVLKMDLIPAEFYINGFFHSCWAKLYLTQIVKDNNIKFPKQKHSEDSIFNIKYLQYCRNLFFSRKIVYTYRHVNAQSLISQFDENGLENYINLHHALENIVDKKVILQTMFSLYYSLIIRLLWSSNSDADKKILLKKILARKEVIECFCILIQNRKIKFIINQLLKNRLDFCILLFKILKMKRGLP